VYHQTCEHCRLFGDAITEYTITWHDERYGHTYEMTRYLCSWHFRQYRESSFWGQVEPTRG